MNSKVIILLIGVFLIVLGIFNGYKPEIEEKYIYKILPRNVYDEILFSLPMSDFDDVDVNNNVYPTYGLGNSDNYDSLFKHSDICVDGKNCNLQDYKIKIDKHDERQKKIYDFELKLNKIYDTWKDKHNSN